MARMESVVERQRGAFEFDAYYKNLCALQNSCPLPQVRAHLHNKVLDINGDRIRVADWIPILGALHVNKTLEFIAIRSYHQNTLDEQEKRGCSVKRKMPAIRSKEVTSKLCNSLKHSLCASPIIKCIELQGLLLRTRDVTLLSKGIRVNGSLQHLSLEFSMLGDDGLAVLCSGIKHAPSVASLNFSGCNLSWRGVEYLSQLIQHQAMQRHSEAWQDSLRYRRPDLDRMSGIRRITLNRNPLLSDQGAKVLAEALKDDLWLKALDVQHCGLSDVGAKYLVDVLKYNTCIVVLDTRNNPHICAQMHKTIMEHLIINSGGKQSEFKWITSEPLQDPCKVKQRRKRTKTLQNSFGRKTTIKIGMSAGRRARSVSSPALGRTPGNDPSTPGIPWRAAMRANRCRGYPPEHSPGKSNMFHQMEGGTPVLTTDGDETTIKIEYQPNQENASRHTARAELASDSETDSPRNRGVRVEMEQLRRRLKEETKARSKAEGRVIELTVENNHLKQEVDDYRAKQSMLDEDRVLSDIETSFQKYHTFLDLLRDAGLGQLITLAGIDQESMPFSKSAAMNANSNGHLNGATASHSAPNLNQDRPIKQRHSPKASKSEATLHPKPQMAFPQITPQNYHNYTDPTMQKPTETGKSQTKSKFDELYQKAIDDTEDALRKSLTEDDLRKSESMGHFYQGTAGSSAPVYRRHEMAAGDASDHSHKSESHKPLSIMELRSMDDLQTTEVKATSTASKHRDLSAKSAKYSDTFERLTDSDIEEDIEDISL